MSRANVKLVLLAGCAVLFCIYFLQILLNTNNGNKPLIDVVLPVVDAPVAIEVPVEDERESWLLVVAVILKASNFDRREYIRKSYINYYEDIYCPYCEKPRENKPKVRVLFFIAREDLKEGSEQHEARIREEQQKYDDVVYLNHIKENMDDGKTFDVFSWIAKNVKTQFVMKTDYDSYVIIPNLVKRLQEVRMIYPSSEYGIYYGYFIHSKEPKISGAFMAGMGYVMSFDIVQYIATADGIDKVGYEDHTVANAIHKYVQHNLQVKNGKKLVFIGDRIHFHDYPQFQGPVSWDLNCKDVVIHQLKTDSDYRTTHDYFSNCCSDDAQKKHHHICLNPPKTRAKCDKITTGKDCIDFMMIKRVQVESGYLYLDDSKL